MRTNEVQVVKSLRSENLFSRSQARQLENLISAAFATSSVIHIDFVGARMISPSFFDEILWIVEESSVGAGFKVYLDNASEPLDRKFSAVAAGHALAISSSEGTSWILTGRDVAVGQSNVER